MSEPDDFESSGEYRIGLGEDLHRLVEGRPLILGGIVFEHPFGLHGHSDGDVVLHAVADALLGAAALGDIGDHFPDTDPAGADADSAELLRAIVCDVRDAGFGVVNVDIVVNAERPKLGEGKREMRARIAGLLGVPECNVNVKAKTGEGLAPIGTGEAIACRAIALLRRSRADTV